MSDRKADIKRARHVANANMTAAIAHEVRMNRASLADDVNAAAYDLNFATDLRMTFGVALKRAIVELDRIGHNEGEETELRMAALRISGDLSTRGLEAYAKLAEALKPPSERAQVTDDNISREEKIAILRAQMKLARPA